MSSTAAPIVTYQPKARTCWMRFRELQWKHLRKLAVARAEKRDSNNVEISEDDIKACLEEAVREALKGFLHSHVNT
ncbi:MAG TPA: hypothetical protein VMY42_03125 [Thermoguttaceae bacterium]|nr:hypothetical protein [Thermoguttaceae bacterium]